VTATSPQIDKPDDSTLVPDFVDGMQQSAVPSHASPIATSALTRFEQGLAAVEHRHALPLMPMNDAFSTIRPRLQWNLRWAWHSTNC
jgi:hypothetical protein